MTPGDIFLIFLAMALIVVAVHHWITRGIEEAGGK